MTFSTQELQDEYYGFRAQQAALYTELETETDPAAKVTIKNSIRALKVAASAFVREHKAQLV